MIDDQDVRHLEVLPRLKSLNLSGSAVTDEALTELASLKSLEELAIGGDTVTPERLMALVAVKHLKTLHIERYAQVTKENLSGLPSQEAIDKLAKEEDPVYGRQLELIKAHKRLRKLHADEDGSYDKADKLTTVTLDHGGQVFALESGVDGLNAAFAALRKAHRGIVIDSDPKWFDEHRGEMRDPKLPGQP